MTNLSQLKRQRMLEFLQKVRDKNKDDDEALSAINEIETELTEKKYGLVWEEHSEEVEERMADEVPIFVEDKEKEIMMTENGYNFLLEGDNLHSLHLLEKTHKEKIDVIYIDPPYNTGKGDFIFEDNYITEEDTYRHSRWLSFIKSRLSIAKKILKDDGIIFISIDDNEYANLRLLCDSIFGEYGFINNFMWLHGKGKKNKQSRTLQQYTLAYCKNNRDTLSEWTMTREARGTFSNPDNDPRGPWFSGSISFSEERSNKSSSKYFKVVSPSGIVWERQWMCTKEEMQQYINERRIYFGEAPGYANTPRLKIYPSDTNELIPDNIIDHCSTTRKAQKELDDIVGKKQNNKGKWVSKFENPKPISLIKHLISITNKRDDITILDFFAGSGTTGQAVLELNKEDGGNRHFILCTNNENGICENVTYPRLKTVITGIRQDRSKYSDGISADLKYYRTDFVPKNDGNLVNQLTKHIDEMIQLEYGVKIDKDKYISILTDEDADNLFNNWNNFPNIRAIYVSRNVLLTGKQKELFETKECFVIPDYYFREELREAGEA